MKRTGRIIEGRIGFGFDGSRHKINSQKQSTQKIYGDRVPNLVTRTRRKADGWGAKSGNWSSQRNNPGRPPRRPDERGPPPPRQRFELTIEEKNIFLEVEPIIFRVIS